MNYGRRRRRYNRFWGTDKKRQAIYESKNFGLDYVTQKYGQDRVNQIVKDLENATRTPGRGSGSSKYTNAGGDGPGKKRYVTGRGYVKVGSSSWNRPRTVDASKSKSQPGFAVGGRFGEGGRHDPLPPPPTDDPNSFPPGTFKPRLKLNLENDEELAQGSQHPWAQPTSISSTITGLLRQAQNAAPNYWDQWALDKGGQYALDSRNSSSFGVDLRWTPDAPQAASQLAASNPMGGFGVSSVFGSQAMAAFNGLPADPPTTPPPGGNQQTPPTETTPPNYPTGGPIVPDDINPDRPPGVYNPWSRGEGGETNAYGPNPQYMADATLQAMSLANAYFAPQRMELAYELGDMETDMRRLAVNLGRQVDDPVLQAKLYKEAMRATRTLDVQQNTFAFQMAEQRRREELQNFQFYDQLGQEEYRLRLANRQFYERLELDRRYYNLQNWNVQHPPTPPGTGSGTTPPVVTPPGGAAMIQSQWPQPAQYQPAVNLAGISANLVGLNPYASSLGGGNVTRSSWGL